jgi:hypothetical protein
MEGQLPRQQHPMRTRLPSSGLLQPLVKRRLMMPPEQQLLQWLRLWPSFPRFLASRPMELVLSTESHRKLGSYVQLNLLERLATLEPQASVVREVAEVVAVTVVKVTSPPRLSSQTPFDFETANARFNKGDLVKEAIAGSPLESTTNGVQSPLEQELAVPKTASYNKASSFFDDLSSESKDRTEASERPGGRNWRGEEQKKNVETFGQGSVDNGYRGYRGRGRGRGGMRGRGSSGYGRGGPRGPRADAQTISQ